MKEVAQFRPLYWTAKVVFETEKDNQHETMSYHISSNQLAVLTDLKVLISHQGEKLEIILYFARTNLKKKKTQKVYMYIRIVAGWCHSTFPGNLMSMQ